MRTGFSFNVDDNPDKKLPELYAMHVKKVKVKEIVVVSSCSLLCLLLLLSRSVVVAMLSVVVLVRCCCFVICLCGCRFRTDTHCSLCQAPLHMEDQNSIFIKDLYKFYLRACVELLGMPPLFRFRFVFVSSWSSSISCALRFVSDTHLLLTHNQANTLRSVTSTHTCTRWVKSTSLLLMVLCKRLNNESET